MVSVMSSTPGPPSARYFPFLRRLRAAGRSNMYGAIPYLVARFGIDRDTAFRVVCEWLDRQAEEAGAESSPERLRRGSGVRRAV